MESLIPCFQKLSFDTAPDSTIDKHSSETGCIHLPHPGPNRHPAAGASHHALSDPSRGAELQVLAQAQTLAARTSGLRRHHSRLSADPLHIHLHPAQSPADALALFTDQYSACAKDLDSRFPAGHRPSGFNLPSATEQTLRICCRQATIMHRPF